MDRRFSGRLFTELLKLEDMGNMRDPGCICWLWKESQLLVTREKGCETFWQIINKLNDICSWETDWSHTHWRFLASTGLHSGIKSTVPVFLWQSRILWLHIHNVHFIWKKRQIGHAAQVYFSRPGTEQCATLKGEEWGNLWELGHKMGCKHLPGERGFAGSIFINLKINMPEIWGG